MTSYTVRGRSHLIPYMYISTRWRIVSNLSGIRDDGWNVQCLANTLHIIQYYMQQLYVCRRVVTLFFLRHGFGVIKHIQHALSHETIFFLTIYIVSIPRNIWRFLLLYIIIYTICVRVVYTPIRRIYIYIYGCVCSRYIYLYIILCALWNRTTLMPSEKK